MNLLILSQRAVDPTRLSDLVLTSRFKDYFLREEPNLLANSPPSDKKDPDLPFCLVCFSAFQGHYGRLPHTHYLDCKCTYHALRV